MNQKIPARAKEPRPHTYRIRLSSAEKDALHAHANEHNITVANLIRQVLLGSDFAEQLPSAPVLKKSLFQLSNISNNINQSVAALNRAVKAGHVTGEVEAVLEALATHHGAIQQAAGEIRTELGKLAR